MNKIKQGEKLLVQNKIKGVSKNSFNNIENQIIQKPNSRILKFFRIPFFISKEEPAIYDSLKTEQSIVYLKDFMTAKGYHHSEIKHELKPRFLNKKKVKSIYTIEPKEPNLINSFTVKCTQRDIRNLAQNAINEYGIKRYSILKFSDLGVLRKNIENSLKDNGYFNFNRSYINIEIDTNQTKNLSDVFFNIVGNDTSQYLKKHYWNNIRVVVNREIEYNHLDTIDGIAIALNGFNLQSKSIANHILLRKGYLSKDIDIRKTYSNLFEMGLFKIVNINTILNKELKDSVFYDVSINLVPKKRIQLKWEPSFTTTDRQLNPGRNYGIGNEFSISNNNLFGNAEYFKFAYRFGAETQFLNRGNFFNTLIHDVSASLTVPKLFLFSRLEKDVIRPDFSKTSISLSYLYENNFNYLRQLSPLSIQYEFKSNKNLFIITPLEIAYRRSEVSKSFQESISAGDSLYINRFFQNGLITSLRIGWIRVWNLSRTFTLQSRLNFPEVGGILPMVFSNITGGGDKILGVRSYRYLRSDLSLVTQKAINNSTWVSKLFIGIGIPLNDGLDLPLEKRYFTGGANSLRGWAPRTIGPGSYSSNADVSIDRTGDINIQLNTEQRFNLYKGALNVEGALFTDAGNIWNIRNTEVYEDDDFILKNFYRQMAWNTGLGIRFDFNYLILRFDWGWQIHNPSLDREKRWVINDWFTPNWINQYTYLSIAVNYPF